MSQEELSLLDDPPEWVTQNPTPAEASLAALFSSDRQDWETPQSLFDALDAEFGFRLDAAASPENAKCSHYYTERDDSLARDWWCGPVWLNPPYGRAIGDWVKKAYQESLKGTVVVVLLFARTDTRWWTEWAMRAAEIRLIQGRVTFAGAPNSAPAPSCLLVFDEDGRSPRFITQSLPRR